MMIRAIRLTHDREADAAYIYLRNIDPDSVARTIPVDLPNGSMNIDIDANGKIIGIEILTASSVLPESLFHD